MKPFSCKNDIKGLIGFLKEEIVIYRLNIYFSLSKQKIVFSPRTKEGVNDIDFIPIHRHFGPARITKNSVEWRTHNCHHREDNKPAYVSRSEIRYIQSNMLHREDGPALISRKGIEWYNHGRIASKGNIYKLIDIGNNKILYQSFARSDVVEREVEYLARGMPVVIEGSLMGELSRYEKNHIIESIYKEECGGWYKALTHIDVLKELKVKSINKDIAIVHWKDSE